MSTSALLFQTQILRWHQKWTQKTGRKPKSCNQLGMEMETDMFSQMPQAHSYVSIYFLLAVVITLVIPTFSLGKRTMQPCLDFPFKSTPLMLIDCMQGSSILVSPLNPECLSVFELGKSWNAASVHMHRFCWIPKVS